MSGKGFQANRDRARARGVSPTNLIMAIALVRLALSAGVSRHKPCGASPRDAGERWRANWLIGATLIRPLSHVCIVRHSVWRHTELQVFIGVVAGYSFGRMDGHSAASAGAHSLHLKLRGAEGALHAADCNCPPPPLPADCPPPPAPLPAGHEELGVTAELHRTHEKVNHLERAMAELHAAKLAAENELVTAHEGREMALAKAEFHEQAR